MAGGCQRRTRRVNVVVDEHAGLRLVRRFTVGYRPEGTLDGAPDRGSDAMRPEDLLAVNR